MRKISVKEKRRLSLQGSAKRVANLEAKKMEQKRIIKTGEKEVRRKIDGEFRKVVKALTPAEKAREREVLAKLELDLIKAKTENSRNKFKYKSSTQKSRNSFRKEKVDFLEGEKSKKLRLIAKLVDKASQNGKLLEFKNISTKLSAKAEYSDKAFRKDVLPILNNYNNGIPITSLSREAILKLKDIIKNIK